MTAKKQAVCAACGATDKPMCLVQTVNGANATPACIDCAEALFAAAGFEHV